MALGLMIQNIIRSLLESMIRPIDSIIFLVIFILLIISNIFNSKLELFVQISLYIIYIFFNLYINPKKFLWYFCPIFFLSINLIGVFLIEFFEGYYLFEIGRITYYKDSLFPIVLYTLIIIYILFGIKLKNINIKKRENKLIDKFIFILLILSILIFLKVVQKPIFMLNIDKYKYSKEYLNFSIQSLINIYQYYLPLFFGYIYITTTSPRTRRNIMIINILMILTLIFIGVKFGGIFYYSYYFLLPVVLKLKVKKIILRKIFRGLIAVIILIIFSISHRILNYNLSMSEGIKGFLNRGFQQGQLWWATYLNKDMIYNEFILSEILNDNEKTRGIYKVMYSLGKHEFIDKLYQIKSVYTASTTSTLYAYFGIKGIYIFSLIYGILILKSYQLIIQSIKKNLWINLIIITRIMVILTSIFSISKFYILNILEGIILLILVQIVILKKEKE